MNSVDIINARLATMKEFMNCKLVLRNSPRMKHRKTDLERERQVGSG